MRIEKATSQYFPTWADLAEMPYRDPRAVPLLTRMASLTARPPGLRLLIARVFLNIAALSPAALRLLRMPWEDILAFFADQLVLSERSLQASLQPVSKLPVSRRHGQLPCTKMTAAKRVAIAKKLCQQDDPILLIGDDDLVSIELARAGFNNVLVVDIDQRLLRTIARLAQRETLRIRTLAHDLRARACPDGVQQDYKLIFIDPIYDSNGIALFLDGASKFVRDLSHSRILLSVHLMSLGREGVAALERMLRVRGLEVTRIERGFNSYPLPKALSRAVFLANLCILRMQRPGADGWRKFTLPVFSSDALLLAPSADVVQDMEAPEARLPGTEPAKCVLDAAG